jgi:tetratricopeptide (TPR) repeat protein
MNRLSWAGKFISIQHIVLGKISALVILLAISLSACSPSQAELNSTATQLAENIFATQTALAPTATQTFTPSPTSTPTPTPTVTPSPSPTLDLATWERHLAGEVISLSESGDQKGAIELCTEAIHADPAFAMAYALRGLIHLGIQDLEAGIADLDRAFELGIDSDLDKEIDAGMTVKALYYIRGAANIQLGAYKQAIEDLERFLAVTEPLEYAQLRANAQYELGQWQGSPRNRLG